MEKNIEQLPVLAGVEAINKNSALHKALAEMQHWQKCSKLLQDKLNGYEDQADTIRLYGYGLKALAVLNIVGWGLAMWFLSH